MKAMEIPDSSVALVFGGHSPIAIACAKNLAAKRNVILVTRKNDSRLEEAFSLGSKVTILEADLEEDGAVNKVITSAYKNYKHISALVFLQRYRSCNEACFSSHCTVELWSIRDALETIRLRKNHQDPLQVWISSSPAAEKAVLDQDLSYHIVKAGQEALVHYYAAALGKENISINAIRIGSIVLKERAMNYWKSVPNLLESLEKVAPIGSILTSEDIGQIFAFFASSSLDFLSGQIITIDNGFSLRDTAQIARELLS